MFDAKAFKALLYNRGVKQAHLARLTEIPKNSLSRYVSGEVQPSVQKIRMLADALGVTMESLIVRENKEMAASIAPPKRQLCFCPNCGVSLMGVAE